MPMTTKQEGGRVRRHARWRRALAWATAIAAAAHAVAFALLVLPFPSDRDPGDRTLTLVPMAPPAREPLRRELTPPGERAGELSGSGERRTSLPRRPDRRSVVPLIVSNPDAPEEATIPSTALDAELVAPTLPLEVGPDGIRRRAPAADSRTLATMRAESLVSARLSGLPGTERRKSGPVSLANGGVTIAIPWQGFLPANRRDEEWREERCSGKDGDESDKLGEAEARASQCS